MYYIPHPRITIINPSKVSINQSLSLLICTPLLTDSFRVVASADDYDVVVAGAGPASHVAVVILRAFRVVIQQLFDQIDVREQHTTAAVPLEPELVQGVAVRIYLFVCLFRGFSRCGTSTAKKTSDFFSLESKSNENQK